MDQILQKCENAIFEGNSQILEAYNQNEETYYLVRSETILKQCPFRQNMTIITRLCDCNCSYEKELNKMHDFINIDTMHKQLETEQVCSYKYFQANQQPFKVGTHNDLLDNLFYTKYNNATIIFEDAHDLPLKLEKAMSSIINTQYVNQVVKTYLQKSEKNNWDQLMNQKLKLLSKTFSSINQAQFNILLPLISFTTNIVQHFQLQQKNEFIIEANKIGELIIECTKNISQQAFIQYMKGFGIQTQNCIIKYQNLNSQNYESYLDELYQSPQRSLFTQWYILIKSAFEMQDSAEIELTNYQTCQSVERVSIDRSIQAPEQQNYKDFKLIINIDCIQNQFNCCLICLNPIAGMIKLQSNGMQNLIIISNHTHPQKLYKTELNLDFKYYPQIPVQQLQLNCMIATKVQNCIIDYLNKNEQQLNYMILEMGKQLQLLNFQLSEHGLITLFSSKSFMQKCQDLWSQHSILSALGVNKEFQWLKYQNKKSVYETLRLFLNKCRFNQIIGDTMPSIYTLFNDMLLDQFQDAIENLQYQQRKNTQTLKNSQQITVLLIGVPWASQSMYNVEYSNELTPQLWLNQKLEWLKNQKSQFDRKHFSTVQAIRNISRLQYILNKLNPCNLIVLDEKFEQKTLWTCMMPPIMTFQEITKELIKITPAMVRSENMMTQNRIEAQQQQKKQTQNIKILIKQPIIQTSKRKIMLNKGLLSDYYNPQKKSMPVQGEKITLEELIGSEKKRETQSETDEAKCVICWSTNQEIPMCKSEKCGHIACSECWKNWLQNKLECPVCRARVREKFLIQI